ncbi:DUF2808 domain-containing protein [Leptolyngbya sp. FACHB-671]|uniref:DUF2808 domain-containing protein n=1 Tax=Leptolyngbya sp. FACHB-671 TaxID=2692812 RepID=UPI001686D93F|nr:DUF2808 domain-containing protein [Leptolyngbya sp. FACHB-671]MBD2070889.1 DUF2808 domain-containing protein [Leptolyngbya sp. FACHB-671]
MRTPTWLGATLAATIGFAAILSPTAQAVQLSDGRVYFERPPSLVDSGTTRNRVSAYNPTYYFTLEVPQDAGEPLGRIEIAQQDASNFVRRVEFEPEDSRAFIGTRGDRGEALTLGNVTADEGNQTVSITFDPPVPPGTVVTLGLKVERNPRSEGVYLFGVTAFPSGEAAYGQFLGYGRFNFYEAGGSLPFSWR